MRQSADEPYVLVQVFISSTHDLAEDRRQVQAAATSNSPDPLRFFARLSEDIQSDGTPERVLRREIAGSKIFFLLQGARWGSPFSADPSKSIVEWEYEIARETGCSIYAFQKDEAEADICEAQREFRSRTGAWNSRWIKAYSRKEELNALVSGALSHWIVTVFVPSLMTDKKILPVAALLQVIVTAISWYLTQATTLAYSVAHHFLSIAILLTFAVFFRRHIM